MKSKLILLFSILLVCGNVSGAKFLPDDPLWRDPDCQPVETLEEVEFSKTYNLLVNTFGEPGDKEPRQASNINTLGEVPDSSWFTNRIGVKEMSIEELTKGPNTDAGPDPSQPWTIVSAKFEGVTPGYVIEDNKGDHYFIKFDAKGYPQMATSAEVVSTKFFHAFGYHVPQNFLVTIDTKKLNIAPTAMMVVDKIRKKRMKEKDVNQIYKRIVRTKDGLAQAVASRVIAGDVIGTFLFNGTRTDDPNDVFAHEDRRELRGLRVFAAWLNHDELQTFNTLDTIQEKEGASCVQHYFIDFNSTFGSGGIKAQDKKAGNEYYFEWDPTKKAAYTLGLWDRPWRNIDYPEHKSVGRFEADYFQPEKWKPVYPNMAFTKMQNEDAFWATKIIMQFTDDRVRSLVKEGKYEDPEAEEYLVRTLITRRDKIVRYYFDQLNPLDNFQVSADNQLTFKNLGIDVGLAPSASYKYQWFRFDNEKSTTEPIAGAGETTSPAIPVPPDAANYLKVRIETVSAAHPNWQKSVDVYLRSDGTTRTVVGIERTN